MTKIEDRTLLVENERLRAELGGSARRLGEAEQALAAIRSGEVDSLVVEGATGPRVFLLDGADSAYRTLVEAMSEGAATLGEDATVLYCNRRFATMLGLPIERVIGSSLLRHLPERSRCVLEALIQNVGEGQSRAEVNVLVEGGSRCQRCSR